MNAEDCEEHSSLIDIQGPDGIWYPWVCECEYEDDEDSDSGAPA